ncbi:DNA primase/polymerase [Microbacterium phage FuzzBuster]|uniref:DNA primase/polymerase n=1 Tax=Microbacterium phage FuzzBuster TaxID=2590935 RepID=A0A516KV58_9CAUD|nr:DNA primase/polymerase [Microbacterium phage FuzzBuster]
MTAAPYRKGAKAYRGLGLGQAIPVHPTQNNQPRRGLIGADSQRGGDTPKDREKLWRVAKPIDPDIDVEMKARSRDQAVGSWNLGIHPDEGIASWDVDDDKEIRKALAKAGLPLPPATPYSTARGADSPRRQLVYRVDPTVWRSNGYLPAGGEVIDVDHRFIRAWPSIHQKTGNRYEWYMPTTDDPLGPGRLMESPPQAFELAELGVAHVAWIAALAVETRTRGERVKDVDGWISGLASGTMSDSLRRLVKAVPTEGAGNNDAMTFFGPLVRAAWDAEGGREAMEEGIERYAGDHGRKAHDDAMHAIGTAIGDEVANREARKMAITFSIDETPIPRSTDAPRAKKPKKPSKSSTKKAAPAKGKKADRKKKAKKAAKSSGEKSKKKPSPARDADYLLAKIETALDDAKRVEFAANELRDEMVYLNGVQPRALEENRWIEVPEPMAQERFRRWHVELAEQMVSTRPKDVAKVLTAASVGATIKLSRGLMAVPIEQFDADPFEINCPNGVVDLRTGKIRERRAGDMFLKQTAVGYDRKARSEAWDEALKALDRVEREWLQMRLGRALVGQAPPDDRAIFLQGIGSNGKSSIMDGTTAVIGDYGQPVSPKVLTAKDGDHSTESMDLLGVRTAILEELPGGKFLSGDHLKRVVGTAHLTARRMRQDPVTFPVTWSLIISTNHDIAMVETDDGAWRRMWVLPFRYQYVEDPIHRNERAVKVGIREHLRAGDPAVLAWLVEGARRAIDDPAAYRDAPESVRLRSTEIRDDNDTMTQFLVECADFDDPEGWTSNEAISAAYNAWMRRRGFAECNVNTMLSRYRSSPLARGTETNVLKKVGGRSLKGVRGVKASMPGLLTLS